MQEVMDEALQRLYWACREGRGFPGAVPDESGGRVSTDAILRGLGLSPPTMDGVAGLEGSSELPLDSSIQFPNQPYNPADIQLNRPSVSTVSSSMSSAIPAVDGDNVIPPHFHMQPFPLDMSTTVTGSARPSTSHHQLPSELRSETDPSPRQDYPGPLADHDGLMFGNVGSMAYESSRRPEGQDAGPLLQREGMPPLMPQPSWPEQARVSDADVLRWSGSLAAVYADQMRDNHPPHSQDQPN